MRFLLDYKLFESVDLVKKRAGIIPYIIENGEVKMLFFIPSDPDYGGDKFQIAKGRVDQGEEVEKTAIREGEEELGLKKENIKSVTLVSKEVISGMDNYNYDFYLYVAEVYNKEDFGEFGYETGEIGWLTIDEYVQKGRKSQLEIVKKCYNKIINI
jgi:8-oxo-dGTP pyrophosphatase MutT (NUDIX family)